MAHSAAWSPDGTTIAYLSDRGGDRGLCLVKADGTGRRCLTRDAFDYVLSWSPDGRRIAFARNADLFVVNADGSGLRRLTHAPALKRSWVEFAWAPAGKR